MPHSATLNTIEFLLKAKTEIDPSTGCWLHTGIPTHRGYIQVRLYGRKTTIHRISACLYLGLNLTDVHIQVCHKLECPNKNCWNPEHLYLGDSKSNAMDEINAGNRIGRTNPFR